MFRFAFQNLLSRPLRTLLSVLGLTVAIAGMVGLFSIAGGIDRMVQTTFDQIPGLLVQQRGAPFPLFSALPAEWGEELAKIPGVSVVNAEALARVNIIEEKPIISPPRFLLGVDIPSRLKLRQPVFSTSIQPGGRFLTEADRGTRNCVISRRLAEDFEKQPGDTMQVNGYALTVVGVYDAGSVLLDGNIVMDLDSVREIARMDPKTVSSYYLEQTGSVSDDELSTAIEDHFRNREIALWQPNRMQQLLLDAFVPAAEGNGPEAPPKDESSKESKRLSPVEVRSQDDWAERFDRFSEDLNLFLTVMTAVGLLIAVFSIVNTMLMSVTERMIEFGILRANGWTQRDVLRLISFESGLLGMAGGIAGGAIGWIAVQGINAWQPQRMNLYAGPGLLAFSVGFSLLLGVMGGLYPAWRAASKSPMEAIRRI